MMEIATVLGEWCVKRFRRMVFDQVYANIGVKQIAYYKDSITCMKG